MHEIKDSHVDNNYKDMPKICQRYAKYMQEVISRLQIKDNYLKQRYIKTVIAHVSLLSCQSCPIVGAPIQAVIAMVTSVDSWLMNSLHVLTTPSPSPYTLSLPPPPPLLTPKYNII